MPLIRNKNQPYFPDPDSPNNYNCRNERYCHPFNADDTFMTQFYQTPCNANQVTDPEFDDYTLSAEMLSNPDFQAGTLNLWYAGASPLSLVLGTYVNGWTGANPNRVYHQTGSTDALNQTGLPFIVGEVYQIIIDIQRTSGSVQVILGSGVEENASSEFTASGIYTFNLVYTDTINNIFQIVPSSDFDGYIQEVSLKNVTLDYWATSGSWEFNGGFACHVEGTTGDLKDTTPNYIDAGGYYLAEITLSNYVQGSVNFYVSDVLVATLNADGIYSYYATPTIAGTIKIEPSSNFIGCISNPSCYELRNDYTAFLVDSNGFEYDISGTIQYYQQYVTMMFDFATVGNYNLPSDCYYVKLYDQCLIESNNLAFNGDFVQGFTDWTKVNGSSIQYDVSGNQLTFFFDPFNQGDTDYVVNGDFSSGTAWTLNAGWTILGGKAVHTPGNTGTLFQTMTLPTPPLPVLGYPYYITFKISNWTTGSVNVAVGSFSYNWAGNDTFISAYFPNASGLVNLTITPTSNFDGELDDFALIKIFSTPSAGDPILANAYQPLLTPGTYQVDYDIVSSSDSRISVNVALTGQVGTTNSIAGSYSYTTTYNTTGGKISLKGLFKKTSIYYPQNNLIAGSITVDNISYKKITPFEATYETECLSFNENGWDKTKMIVAWCDQPSFGFEFENTGFKLQQRALIRSINPSYPSQKLIQKMGSGNARMVYAELEKYWEVYTDFASETFHDCMAVQLECDHLQIGDTQGVGKEYIANGDEYSPNWQGDGATSLASATFEIRIKEKGQIFNRHI